MYTFDKRYSFHFTITGTKLCSEMIMHKMLLDDDVVHLRLFHVFLINLCNNSFAVFTD